MNILGKKLRKIAILTIAVAFIGCNEDDGLNGTGVDSDELFAGFTQTIDQSTGNVDFINVSNNAESYLWDFGDGTISREINPSKVYENGSYLVSLTASNSDGLSDTFEDSVTINVPDPVVLPITFDDSNVNYDAEPFDGTQFDVLANPDESGTNNKASNVARIINSGMQFEGIFFNLGTAIDFANRKTIRMNFWSNAAIDILLKMENGTAGDVEVSASHTGSGWESLDFDFSSDASYSTMTLFVDAFGTSSGTFYFDDVEQILKVVTEPTTAAPTPTRDAANVISLFSDAYTDVTVDTYRTTWSVGDLENVTVGGNAALKYSNVDFVGIETTSSTVDVTAMTHIHLDVWSNDITAFTVRLVDFGADGMFDGGDDAQADVADNMPARGEWISYDIPLSQFTELITSSNIAQYVLVAQPTGNATIFVDNIYFYDENGSSGGGGGGGGGDGGGGSGGTGAFPLDFEDGSLPFTAFENGVATIQNVDNPNTTGNTSSKVVQFNKAAGSDWFAGMVYTGPTDPPLVDLSNGMIFKIKVLSPNAGVNFRFQIEAEAADQASIPTYNIDQTVNTANEWVELTYDFSTTAASPTAQYTKVVIFPDFDASNQVNPTVGVIYHIDDITQE